jgi:hypothetical protein
MGFVPIMWGVWVFFVAVLAALYFYRAGLLKEENDQLVLDDVFESVRKEDAAIVAKVKKIEPVMKIVLWLAGATTLFIIVYYIRDILIQLNFIQ